MKSFTIDHVCIYIGFERLLIQYMTLYA